MTWDGLTPPYRTIVADPPWRFRNPGAVLTDARKHYTTMTLPDICSLPVEELADEQCHLWLWALNGLMEEAHQVARAWGFTPITILTWCKPPVGLGYYLMTNTEHLILASRGKPQVPDKAHPGSWFIAPRGSHSRKPPAALDIVEQVSPGPYVELFCRQPRFGWDSWGLGFENFEAVQ